MGLIDEPEPIHICLPGHPDDPRDPPDLPDGVIAHHGPPLHPDDVTILNGVPVTSVARTLIDLAEVLDAEQLRGCFAAARDRDLLDLDQLAAARARVEWRPSLATLDEIAGEFS